MTTLCGGWRLVAQEAGRAQVETKARKTSKRTVDPTRRVPYYFGQLGLSDAQKESIYKIQAKHQPQFEALEKQLEELRAGMVKECESVLTDAQRTMLNERRTSAAEARSKRSSAAALEAKPKG
jgi:hypothetical protein